MYIYISKLKKTLAISQKENPSYSLRAFAKKLDMHSATLSMVLNGKRSIPKSKYSQPVDTGPVPEANLKILLS